MDQQPGHRLCCLLIASKFSRLADQAVGDLKVDLFQKATNARAQADELKALALREGNVPTPYAGGLTVSDKDIDRDNSDMIQPSFVRNQFRDPLAGSSSVRQDFGSLAD